MERESSEIQCYNQCYKAPRMKTNDSLTIPRKDVSIIMVSVHCFSQSFGTKTENSFFISSLLVGHL